MTQDLRELHIMIVVLEQTLEIGKGLQVAKTLTNSFLSYYMSLTDTHKQ